MAIQVQLRRGTTAEHVGFTGAVGEVTVDTTKDVCVVHDGATAGGFPLAPETHATAHKDGGADELLLHELGDPTASVEFAQQQALQFRVENRTSDPGTPATGQIWLRTDL